MDILLVNTRVLDPASPYHDGSYDVLISDGQIVAVEAAHSLEREGRKVLEHEGQMVSPSWIDMRCHIPDPGYEHRETVISALKMGARSGFSGLLFCPDTYPAADRKEVLAYWRDEASESLCRVLPMGALTKELKGREMAELFDLHRSGALCFGDANMAIERPGLVLKALMYTQLFEGLVSLVPAEADLPQGDMHEGLVNVRLGLEGNPSLRETMALERYLGLLRYSGGRLHCSLLSSREGVELLRNAKAEGLAVTCDVSMYHLCFCDEDLLDYSTQLKFHPPLRSADDRAALRAAVADGTIDAVVSDHQPWEIDRKDCEFALAAPGAIGTQGLFSAALHAVGDLERVVYALTQAPRKCLRLPEERIEPGRPANLTVFDPHARWTWNGETNLSFSNNTPFWNQPMQGKALATIAGMAHVFNTYF